MTGVDQASPAAAARPGTRSARGVLALAILVALVLTLGTIVTLSVHLSRMAAGVDSVTRTAAASVDLVGAVALVGDDTATTADRTDQGLGAVERTGATLELRARTLHDGDRLDAATADAIVDAADALVLAARQEAAVRALGNRVLAADIARSRTSPAAADLAAHLQEAAESYRRTVERDRTLALVLTALLVPLVVVVAALVGRRLTRLRSVDADRARFEAVVDALEDVVLLTDRAARVSYASPSTRYVWGRRPEDLTGRPVTALVTSADLEAVTDVLRRIDAEPERVHRTEVRAAHTSGVLRVLDTGVHRLTPDTLVWTLRDVSDDRRAAARLDRMGLHDALTGLPNRTLLLDRMGQALARRSTRGGQVALLLLDLDGFSDVNTGLGYAAGDRILVDVARLLREATSAADTVARVGGDAFAVLLDSLPDGEQARATADRIGAELAATPFATSPCPDEPAIRQVGATIGVAVAAEQATAAGLLRDAATALQVAKGRGRRTVTLFEDAMHVRAAERLTLLGGVPAAVDRGELVLLYQPVVSIRTGRVVTAEALVRWQHPTLGLLLPEQFVALAEEFGGITELGRWVLDTACAQSSTWTVLAGDRPPVRVAVNVSARHLLETGFVDDVAKTLDAHGIAPESLLLELTESTVVEDLAGAERRMRDLRALGVRIALDDFGTGYSALSYLDRLPLDVLKVDRSFLGGHAPERLLAGVHDLATRLGLLTVAEGVETPDQDRLVRRAGLDAVQGFLHGPPTDAATLGERLAAEAASR